MNKLEYFISIALQEKKSEYTARKWDTSRRCFNHILKLASSMGVDEPCQSLYNAFEAQGKRSREKLNRIIGCIKLLDAAAGTKAFDTRGVLYNERSLPGRLEVEGYFSNRQIPFTSGASIDHLIVRTSHEMAYLGLSASTIGQYWNAWLNIRRYFVRNDAANYDEGLVKRYLLEADSKLKSDGMALWKWKISRKAAHALMEVAKTGRFQWKAIKAATTNVGLEIAPVRDQYLSSLASRNLSSATISLHDYVFRNTMAFIRADSIGSLSALDADEAQRAVVGFASVCSKQSMPTISRSLRSLLTFLYDAGYTQTNLSGAIMPASIHRGSVAAYISNADMAKLAENLDKESKRTKAIVLLAMKLGLRDCDICGLTFQQIDWLNDKIRINQKKTGEPLVLPLLPAVGNALMDYILRERPKRGDRYPYIFLREQAPHMKLSSVYNICSKLLEANGIAPVNGTSAGANVFRRTMVYRMLASKVPYQVITDALGHVSKETDKPYLSMDEPMLRTCALDLSAIGRVSWEGRRSD
jgi:integrase